MNKYFVPGVLLVLACMAITSCHKTDLYDENRTEKDAREIYRANFLKYVGGYINNKVDWGFGAKAASRAQTRAKDAVIVLNTGYGTIYDKAFMDIAMKYFPEDENRKSMTPVSNITHWEFHQNAEWANIHLICSNTSSNDEVGIYYYDPATETPEQAKKFTLIENIQKGLDSYYKQEVVKEQFESASTTGGFWVWKNGVTRIECNAFNEEMDPSYYFGLYVKNLDTGKTYYTNANLNEKYANLAALVGHDNDAFSKEIENCYVFGLSDDDVPGCELIFAIKKRPVFPLVVIPEKKEEPTPPEPEPEPEWHRIIAEDLNVHDVDLDGEHDDTDFDFNDIVLDVALVDGGAKCILQAAGATLKIRINGDDNLEVHKLFGVGEKDMVNTKKGPTKSPVEFDLQGSFASIDKIKIEVYRQNRWMELTAPKGDAASKIAVAKDFEWPDERQSLKAKYPNFLKYVQDPEKYAKWWNEVVK